MIGLLNRKREEARVISVRSKDKDLFLKHFLHNLGAMHGSGRFFKIEVNCYKGTGQEGSAVYRTVFKLPNKDMNRKLISSGIQHTYTSLTSRAYDEQEIDDFEAIRNGEVSQMANFLARGGENSPSTPVRFIVQETEKGIYVPSYADTL